MINGESGFFLSPPSPPETHSVQSCSCTVPVQVVDGLIIILKALNAQGATVVQRPEIKRMCEAVYTVLNAFVTGDSRKNELYIARHFALFLKQVNSTNGALCFCS